MVDFYVTSAENLYFFNAAWHVLEFVSFWILIMMNCYFQDLSDTSESNIGEMEQLKKKLKPGLILSFKKKVWFQFRRKNKKKKKNLSLFLFYFCSEQQMITG